MRVRKRKWVAPFLEQEDQFYIRSNAHLQEVIAGRLAFIEIGSGHGEFLCQMGLQNPENVYIGFEKDTVCVARSIKKIEEYGVSNVFFINNLAERSLDIIQDVRFDGMYLQFSDPWPKSKHYARRLTYRTFLKNYEQFLKPEAFLYMKTDNLNLFEFTLEEIAFSAFTPVRISYDFHKEIGSNIKTAYESKFVAQGLPIYHVLCHIDESTRQVDIPRTGGTPAKLLQQQ